MSDLEDAADNLESFNEDTYISKDFSNAIDTAVDLLRDSAAEIGEWEVRVSDLEEERDAFEEELSEATDHNYLLEKEKYNLQCRVNELENEMHFMSKSPRY